MKDDVVTGHQRAELPGLVGVWRLAWEDEGLVELAPLSHGKLIPSGEAVLAEGQGVLPSWLWDGWIRFWRGEDPAVPLVGRVPPFFGRVYAVVRRIPVGGARTNRQVAEEVGVPEGARAVGQAMRKNPWALFVPCHRVVRTDGGLAGYGGPTGTPLKRALLLMEGVTALPGAPSLKGGRP